MFTKFALLIYPDLLALASSLSSTTVTKLCCKFSSLCNLVMFTLRVLRAVSAGSLVATMRRTCNIV